MFKQSSQNLYDFFHISGMGFYIPFYQRKYSWDQDNVKKLLDDLVTGVNEVVNDHDYIRFIGNLILFPMQNPETGTHYDRRDLITRVVNVIDGQQRISTIAIISILLSARLSEILEQLKAPGWAETSPIDALIDSIETRGISLRKFYSVESELIGATPRYKPKIIRGLHTSSSPVTDQWTLKGNYKQHYQSEIGNLIAEYIESSKLIVRGSQRLLKQNIKLIKQWIADIEHANLPVYPDIQELIELQVSSYGIYLADGIEIEDIESLDSDKVQLVEGVIRLLAFVQFFMQRTWITAFECDKENLAYDMFESLNATGTPLTAIEVFRPLVVNTLGKSYASSNSAKYFGVIDEYFNEQKSAEKKESETNEILLRVALVHNGLEPGKRFGRQRDWLHSAYQQCGTDLEKENLVRWISEFTEYWKNIVRSKAPKLDATSFEVAPHLIRLGLFPYEADIASLCVYFLRDASHSMVHGLLSLFYAKLLRAQGDPTNVRMAADEFVAVCKASTAFFVMWVSSGGPGSFPDEAYRKLFRDSGSNLSWSQGLVNQNVSFVKTHFQKELETNGGYDRSSIKKAKSGWVNKAKVRLGYHRQQVCRFALFLAAHDMAPDISAPGREGLVVRAPGSASYLTCDKWFSSKFKVMEHIANRKPTSTPIYGSPDVSLYPPGDTSVVDKIGNLTLWSRSANSSTYPEWPDKVYYYATLTRLAPMTDIDLAALASTLRVVRTPPGLSSTASASKPYIANLAPIAYRGQQGKKWDKAFVDARTEQICELVFDELNQWIT